MGPNSQTNREPSEKGSREEIEKRLMDEAQRTVDYLQGALESAPDDEQLRARLQRVLDQARALRDAIKRALAGAGHAKEREGEAPAGE